MTQPLLTVENLNVGFATRSGIVQAATDINFEIFPGEVLAVVGESGSGKSVTALALMRLHPENTIITGNVNFDGHDLLNMSDRDMRAIRGSDVAMIFQDPMTAMNPVFSVGNQIVETIRVHDSSVSKQEAWTKAVDLLKLVGVPEPKQRVSQYPHEYSGGMRQRAMIAMAIANDPKLLIADEPTTALDVTVQAQVMEVLHEVQAETGSAMMLITHDLGLVAGSADRVQVMYASRLMETGSIDQIFYESQNPYTRALLESIPDIDGLNEELSPIPGNPPSLLNPLVGCAFRPRCKFAQDVCATEVPPRISVGVNHTSRCALALELPAPAGASAGDAS
ncbi:ABC transporter ATP-binding protein [uncultured Ilumatobacter sp.]|jgi:oligopeptide/dipeptide ABC transporter ATP-binding protein|uniref:ABC transporter ATP-binding protein n=1 Tax=uncultured Ilumatobacter sp. TaxID=879968 RepID=UPI00374E4355